MPGAPADVAQHGFRSGDISRGGQVVGQRRVEKGLGRILAYLFGVLLFHRLLGIAAWSGLSEQR